MGILYWILWQVFFLVDERNRVEEVVASPCARDGSGLARSGRWRIAQAGVASVDVMALTIKEDRWPPVRTSSGQRAKAPKK